MARNERLGSVMRQETERAQRRETERRGQTRRHEKRPFVHVQAADPPVLPPSPLIAVLEVPRAAVKRSIDETEMRLTDFGVLSVYEGD